MDNRYLFRGKRSDIGEWVEGYPFQHLKSTYILPLEASESTHTYFFDCAFDIDPSTLGQCTGLKDKRGKLIFEGDICRDSMDWAFKVIWDCGNVRFIGRHHKARGDTYICYVGREPAVEIIGNIYDNPDLLEKTERRQSE